MEETNEQYQELKKKYNLILMKYEVGDIFCKKKEEAETRFKNLGIQNIIYNLNNDGKLMIASISGTRRYPKCVVNKTASKKIRIMSRLLAMYDFFSEMDLSVGDVILPGFIYSTVDDLNTETGKKRVKYSRDYKIPENFFIINLMEILDDCKNNNITNIKTERVVENLQNIYYLFRYSKEIPTYEMRNMGAEREDYQRFEINQNEVLSCKRKIFENVNSLKSYLIQCYSFLMDEDKDSIKKVEISAEEVLGAGVDSKFNKKDAFDRANARLGMNK